MLFRSTKADKLKRGGQQRALLSIKQKLPESISAQVFSAPKKQGLDLLEATLREWFLASTGFDGELA